MPLLVSYINTRNHLLGVGGAGSVSKIANKNTTRLQTIFPQLTMLISSKEKKENITAITVMTSSDIPVLATSLPTGERIDYIIPLAIPGCRAEMLTKTLGFEISTKDNSLICNTQLTFRIYKLFTRITTALFRRRADARILVYRTTR